MTKKYFLEILKMEDIFEQILHKLWMIDHHKNDPDIYIRNLYINFHYGLLRENLAELEVNSAHIKNTHLRDFAVETLLKNGYIYEYNIAPKKCLSPIEIDDCETRDFAAETLLKNSADKNFNVDTLT